MASINIHTRQVEKTMLVEVEKTEFVEEEVVVLELSKDEAQLLMDVISRVSGCPQNTRRALAENIYGSLANNGFRYQATYDETGGPIPTDVHGGIFMLVEPKVEGL